MSFCYLGVFPGKWSTNIIAVTGKIHTVYVVQLRHWGKCYAPQIMTLAAYNSFVFHFGWDNAHIVDD